ncbi:MAG: hypothetical protein A2V77_18255 [Anaeromyxobacter sp. RBG_16_69_14]|nr:MAG: hypothetical protein A2V77_18255 [Anaeromyxobacter sp. RBG_16_69_14]
MKDKPKRPRLSEDWLALWLGLFIFVLSLGVFAGVDVLGWGIQTNVWIDPGKALAPASASYEKMSGPVSLLLTYVFMTFLMVICAKVLDADIKEFLVGFTLVFWISYTCWLVGNNAYIAATTRAEMDKFGITWAMKLTGEAGFIVALIAGLVVGNFFPKLADVLKEATRPELYIKTAIVILGGALGVMAAEKLGLATAVILRSLCAIVGAYLIYWAGVYFIARKYFKFSREWAAPLASGISICGVSAAIATGGAIKARPVVPIMVSSLVVIFAVVELVFLPLIARDFLYREPIVAGAWMGLAVKTDGAAVASGAIADSLIRGRASAEGINYQPDWIMGTAATVKVFIDVFIGLWAFVLAIIWCTLIERRPGEAFRPGQIWERFPKFVIGYVITFLLVLLVCWPASKHMTSLRVQLIGLNKQLAAEEAQLATAKGDATAIASQQDPILVTREKIAGLDTELKSARATISAAKTATGEANVFRGLFFVMTFFSIGVVSDFRKLWAEGFGKLAAVYVISLFGFIIWVGLAISWLFFHGVRPPRIG